MFKLPQFATAFLATAFVSIATPAFADQYFDAGIKSFQTKKYGDAVRYFEQSIKNARWESNTFYYCALSYHYMGDFKKAAEKYGECVERFPGTQASTSALAALKVVDPGYMKRKEAAVAAATAAAAAGKTGTPAGAVSTEKDKGTIEGQAETRLMYRLNGTDKVVDLLINGRHTRAIFDPNNETTSVSRQQLASLAINPDKSAIEMKCDIALGGVVRKKFPITVDDSGSPARIGNSFLDAFSVNVNDSAKTIEIKRRSASGGAAASSVAFTRDGKDVLVNAEVNGRSLQMIFDPSSDGISMTTKQAKSAGLKVDEAEAEHQNPAEGPQRGDPNWIPPDERAPAPKHMAVRMKFGPVDRPGINCTISEQGAKYPKLGGELVNSNGYKFDIDYKSNKVNFTRK